MMQRNEYKILDKAVATLHELTGLDIEADNEPRYRNGHGVADAILYFRNQHNDVKFYVEIIPNLTMATYGAAVARLGQFRDKGLLIAQYIPQNIADQLREMNIPFIDTAGNAYINLPTTFIYITGRKQLQPVKRVTQGRIFQAAGIKVVFALLCNPGLETKPYREIERMADVALGTIDATMKTLKQMGYLIDMGLRGRRLVNKENLLNRWVEAYAENLRPKIILGRYAAKDPDWLQHVEQGKTKIIWGGETAANKITNYLKPGTVTAYIDGKIGELVLRNKLKKDPYGEIEILNKFWKFNDEYDFNDLAPPLLVYADLIATGDQRNIETARIIYDEELHRFIRED